MALNGVLVLFFNGVLIQFSKLHYVAALNTLDCLESRIRNLAWPYSTIASINTVAAKYYRRHLAEKISNWPVGTSFPSWSVGWSSPAKHGWNLCGKECIQCPEVKRQWTCVFLESPHCHLICHLQLTQGHFHFLPPNRKKKFPAGKKTTRFSRGQSWSCLFTAATAWRSSSFRCWFSSSCTQFFQSTKDWTELKNSPWRNRSFWQRRTCLVRFRRWSSDNCLSIFTPQILISIIESWATLLNSGHIFQNVYAVYV